MGFGIARDCRGVGRFDEGDRRGWGQAKFARSSGKSATSTRVQPLLLQLRERLPLVPARRRRKAETAVRSRSAHRGLPRASWQRSAIHGAGSHTRTHCPAQQQSLRSRRSRSSYYVSSPGSPGQARMRSASSSFFTTASFCCVLRFVVSSAPPRLTPGRYSNGPRS